MTLVLSLIAAGAFLAVGFVVILQLLAGPDPPAGPPDAPRPAPPRDRLFRPDGWKKATGDVRGQAGYRRPMDVQLPNDQVLEPPRDVNGINGEG